MLGLQVQIGCEFKLWVLLLHVKANVCFVHRVLVTDMLIEAIKSRSVNNICIYIYICFGKKQFDFGLMTSAQVEESVQRVLLVAVASCLKCVSAHHELKIVSGIYCY